MCTDSIEPGEPETLESSLLCSVCTYMNKRKFLPVCARVCMRLCVCVCVCVRACVSKREREEAKKGIQKFVNTKKSSLTVQTQTRLDLDFRADFLGGR